jgi:nitrate/nitrite-specific signal transduction histidine kinase
LSEEQSFLEVLAAEVAGALESVRARSRDLLTLYEVDQALRAEANLGRLLERLIDRILAWAGASGGGVLLLDEENFLQPQVLRDLELSPYAFMPEQLWKEALEKPVFVRDNLLAVPLREQSAIGLLLVQDEAENLRQRLPFLRFLAAQVTLAVRNAQAYLRAEELALTEERNRIAREIHDGIAQALAFMALKLDLSELKKSCGRSRKPCEARFVKFGAASSPCAPLTSSATASWSRYGAMPALLPSKPDSGCASVCRKKSSCPRLPSWSSSGFCRKP